MPGCCCGGEPGERMGIFGESTNPDPPGDVSKGRARFPGSRPPCGSAAAFFSDAAEEGLESADPTECRHPGASKKLAGLAGFTGWSG